MRELLNRHETLLQRFWADFRHHPPPRFSLWLADFLHRFSFFAFLLFWALGQFPLSLAALIFAAISHPALRNRVRVVLMFSLFLLGLAQSPALLFWGTLFLVAVLDLLLFQSYEYLLLVPFWLLYELPFFPAFSERFLWVIWGILGILLAQKFADPPVPAMLEDPEFLAWLTAPGEDGEEGDGEEGGETAREHPEGNGGVSPDEPTSGASSGPPENDR